MDICEGALGPVLRDLAAQSGWICESLGSSRALMTSGRRFADSEPVEVVVSIQGEVVTVSDGGVMLARLTQAGFDVEDDVLAALWRDALYEFRLGYSDGLVQVSASISTSAMAAIRLADALLGLDVLRLVALPKGSRVRTFASDVEEYLRGTVGEAAVTRSPTVTVGEMVIRPTLRVQAKTGSTLIQTAATTSFKQAFEHAFFTFSLIERFEIVPVERRLVILGGAAQTWGSEKVRMLADVAYVGLWAQRDPIDRFLSGAVPAGHLLFG